MKNISLKQVKSLRKSRNQEILWRMDSGESLTSFNSHSSWYPPRPVVQKDSSAVRRLYGSEPDERLEKASLRATSANETSAETPVLKLAQ